MKKSILFVAVLFLMGTTNISAQQFGIQAGPSFSSGKQETTLEGMFSVDMNYNTKTTFTGGVFGNFKLGSMLAIQPEINYLQKGGDYSDKETDIDYDFKINYIEVPVYLLYNGGKTSGFFGGVGPSFNYGISGKYKMDGQEEKIKFGKEKDIQAFHAAINVQAGYQWENGFLLNAFFSQSLTNSASEMEVTGEEVYIKASNKFNFTTYGLRVGYRFNVNKEGTQTSLKTIF